MAVKTKALALCTMAECTSELTFRGNSLFANLGQTSAIKINVEHSSEAVVFNYQST